MIILLSPAKTFAKETMPCNSTPIFYKDALSMIHKLKRCSVSKLSKDMGISIDLAQEAQTNYRLFEEQKTCAIYAYDGYAFKGFDINSLKNESQTYLSSHLYILSGLFGLVRPYDCISPYRLEIKDKTIKNLYDFWKPKIKDYMDIHHPNQILINLASKEYSKVLDETLHVTTISFYQNVNHTYKSISMHVKFMRGKMANYLISNQIEDLNQIKSIDLDGYTYDLTKSSDADIAFSKEVNL